MKKLSGKTALITGASRGIGRELALMLARNGANLVLAAKTKDPHQFLEGTIESVAQEVTALGGVALPVQTDVRDEAAIDAVVKAAVERFSTIDILINNAGAIYLTDTLSTGAKQFDLMHDVNVRATFLLSRACLPYLKKQGGHILNLSPPISLESKWLSPHVAYTMSKYGMSMCTMAMSEEFREYRVAVNSLWPKTLIYTAAITRLMGEEAKKNCRSPKIIADAAEWIFCQDPRIVTGNLFLDEEVMIKAGIKDLDGYACIKGSQALPDLYVAA